MNLHRSKIAIIGCGYVGKALAKHWTSSKNYTITVTTRSQEKAKELSHIADNVHILAEINEENLFAVLQNQDIVVITIAADNAGAYEKTYLNTAKVLAKVLSKPHSVKLVIYTSSTSVYGEHGGAWVDEMTTPVPHNSQTQILLETETTLLSLKSPSTKVSLFRLGEIYGPNREISERLRRLNGKALPGTGENYTNLIHVDHIVRIIDQAVQLQLQGIFNLCEDLHLPRMTFYQRICQKENLPQPAWDNKISPHGGNKKVSNAKIKQALQLSAIRSFLS